jgi:hypothetical protein
LITRAGLRTPHPPSRHRRAEHSDGGPDGQAVPSEINLDIGDSKPDWQAFLPDTAREGAPNVLVVLYDDTGCAAWSPYGGRIEMPTLQRPADGGLTYAQ